MKFIIAGVAILAAAAALVFRPPHPADAVAAHPQPPAHPRHVVAAARPNAQIVVYVAGEVVHPGVYRFASDARTTDAIDRAGGMRPGADPVAVNLAAPLHDGDEIAVPKLGAGPAPRRSREPRPRATHQTRSAGRAPSVALAPQRVDLNAADERELQTLPGVGPALAARIIAYRETNGPFDSVDELADISGITPHIIDAIIPYATVR
jgi:competence protein ComEA